MRATVVSFVFSVPLLLSACGNPVETPEPAPAEEMAGLCSPDPSFECGPIECIEPNRQGWSYFTGPRCTGIEYGMTDANGLKVTWDGLGCLRSGTTFSYASLRDSKASGGFCWNYGTSYQHPSPGFRVLR